MFHTKYNLFPENIPSVPGVPANVSIAWRHALLIVLRTTSYSVLFVLECLISRYIEMQITKRHCCVVCHAQSFPFE